jgi:hypothetical protein
MTARATKFNVWRKDGVTGTYALIGTQNVASGGSLNYHDTTVQANHTYFYKAQAANNGGTTPFSNEVFVTFNIPSTPTLAGSASDLAIHLTTGATTYATSYLVYRNLNSAGYVLLATVNVSLGAALDFFDTDVLESDSMSYKVKAASAAGASGFSNVVTESPSALPTFTSVDPTTIAGNVIHFRILPQGSGGSPSDGLNLSGWPDGSPPGWAHTCTALSDPQQPLIFKSGSEGPGGKKFISFDDSNQSGFSILQNGGPEATLMVRTIIAGIRFWNNTATLFTLLPDIFVGAGSPTTVYVNNEVVNSTYVPPNGNCIVLTLEYSSAVQWTALGGHSRFFDIVDLIGFSSALSSSDRNGVGQYERNTNALPYRTPVIVGTTAPTNPPIIFVDGDSHSVDADFYAKLQAALPGTYTWHNVAIAGSSFAHDTVVANIAAIYSSSSYVIGSIWAGTNEVANGTPSPLAAIVEFRAKWYCQRALRQGLKGLVYSTATKRDFSGDVGTEEAQRTLLNTFVLANPTLFGNFIADVGAASQLQNTSDLTYFQADKAHFTPAGNTVCVNIIAPEITAALV